jgi:ribokinase
MAQSFSRPVSILGIFVADTAYTASRLPRSGETLHGSGFAIGPGGKGSNQAVAAALAGAEVHFISRIGNDEFGRMAMATYEKAGVHSHVRCVSDLPTGAAFIFVNELSGENAIIVYSGAGGTIGIEDAEAARSIIENSGVFVTQLEQPADAARRGMEIARAAGVKTVFNPSPADQADDKLLALADFLVPNEGEAEALSGVGITSVESARHAGDVLLARGAGQAIITLGDRGVLVHGNGVSELVPARPAAKVVDTSGAGDAFLGSFAAAIAEERTALEAARFATSAAGIAVTRAGTSSAMPTRDEIEASQA